MKKNILIATVSALGVAASAVGATFLYKHMKKQPKKVKKPKWIRVA